jgi:uracil-DNA glycosylase family 4
MASSQPPWHNPAALQSPTALERLNARIVRCRRCNRLVAHRETVAAAPPRRYTGQRYWARPLPGFGDPRARLLLVGLAPAANGGNRTGRMFTGDRSGDWLFDALHHGGFANQATSVHADDGLRLRDAYITATIRCAPPLNKPLPAEILACRPYLLEELRLLDRVRVVVGLGRIGWEAYLRARRALGHAPPPARPVFAHGAASDLGDGVTLIACYHPSQQNTFTGKLTRPMLRSVFTQARRILDRASSQS